METRALALSFAFERDGRSCSWRLREHVRVFRFPMSMWTATETQDDILGGRRACCRLPFLSSSDQHLRCFYAAHDSGFKFAQLEMSKENQPPE